MADFDRNADGQPSVDPTITQNLVRCRTASFGVTRMLATERPGHPLALFIPGVMTEVTTTWLRVIPLTSLFNIIVFELPGHGISQEVADVSTEAFALEYAAFIDRYVAPAQRICVIGESFGGLIGAAMARLHPDRIAHLVLLETPFRLTRAPFAALLSNIWQRHSLSPYVEASS